MVARKIIARIAIVYEIDVHFLLACHLVILLLTNLEVGTATE